MCLHKLCGLLTSFNGNFKLLSKCLCHCFLDLTWPIWLLLTLTTLWMTSLALTSPGFAQHGKWMTLTAVNHARRSKPSSFGFKGSNSSSLLAMTFPSLSPPYWSMRCSNHEVVAFLCPPSLRFSFPSFEEFQGDPLSRLAGDFLGFNTEAPICWQTVQCWAHWNSWSPTSG